MEKNSEEMDAVKLKAEKDMLLRCGEIPFKSIPAPNHEPAEPVAATPECNCGAKDKPNIYDHYYLCPVVASAKPAAPAIEPQKEHKWKGYENAAGYGTICENCKITVPYPRHLPDTPPEAGSTRPEMPPVEKRMICKACCTEVCSHGKCPNCHIRCKDCMEGELRAASVQQEPPPDDEELFKAVAVLTNYGVTREMYEEYLNKVKSQPAAPRTQDREELHEKEMLEVIDERDHWEEVIEKLAESAGCKEEWSNLHEHGDCIAERILELEAQARTQPAPRPPSCPRCEKDPHFTLLQCGNCGIIRNWDKFFTALPEAQPTKKENE